MLKLGSTKPFTLALHCMGIFLIAEFILIWGIYTPSWPYFDEVFYIRAAKQILNFVPNQNIEHPPLGKMVIAAGIGLFGDNPLGWRLFSTIFGSATLAGVYLWGLALFRDSRAAWIAVLATLLNQMWYVESRLAVIDTFMVAFLTFALTAFCFALNSSRRRSVLAFSGICFGLAIACKWSAIPIYFCCLFVLLFRSFIRDSSKTLLSVIITMLVLPAIAYFISFTPYFFVDAPGYRPSDWWMMQTNIWDAQMLTPGETPYNSPWYEWPFMLRPYWYWFSPNVPAATMRGILLIGNPLILWVGLLALLVSAYRGLRAGTARALLILSCYLVLLAFPWILISRKASYFYYYYPAALTLSLALAFMFSEGGKLQRQTMLPFFFLALLVFIFYFPFLSGIELPMPAFRAVANWLPPIYIWKTEGL